MAGSLYFIDSESRSAERLVRREDCSYRAVSRSEMLLIEAHVGVELMWRAIRARLHIGSVWSPTFSKIKGKIEESFAGRFITWVGLEPTSRRLTGGS
jgi:hypothetical protein